MAVLHPRVITGLYGYGRCTLLGDYVNLLFIQFYSRKHQMQIIIQSFKTKQILPSRTQSINVLNLLENGRIKAKCLGSGWGFKETMVT